MTKIHNTILVIDDNDINRKYLRSVLSNSDFTPIIASSGMEALELLEEQKPDLILIDIQMPEMDGFDCYREIKLRFELNCPMLAITAFSDHRDKERVLQFGFDDFIVKPVKPDVLLGTIRHWIDLFQGKGKDLNLSFNANSEEHIDHGVLNDLLRFTDSDSLFSLIDEFVEETKSHVQSIVFLRGTKDYTEILSILHVIKGNAGSFGFTILSSKAANIEVCIKENRFEETDLNLDDFLNYSDFLLRDYQRLLKID